MKTQKMVKVAKVLEKVCKILQWASIIGAAVSVAVLGVFTVIQAVNPQAAAGMSFHVIGVGPFSMELTEEEVPDFQTLIPFFWEMTAIALIFVGLLYATLGVFRKILRSMAEVKPFIQGMSGSIRKLAFMSLAIGIVHQLFSVVATLNIQRVFDINSLLQNSQIQSISTNYVLDLNTVIVFCVLLLLSYIFHYGEELQKLSDETL